jgi:hypothetical protein
MKWISDPGHAWLEVSLERYPDAVNYSTGHGFIDEVKGLAYLEEDTEAPAFIASHMGRAAFIALDVANIVTDSPAAIRTLPRLNKSLDYDAAMKIIYGSRAAI